MAEPRRIQLKRTKGFNLQAASMALNGLPAVKVDRTTKWGNPYTVAECGAYDAVQMHRRYMGAVAHGPLWEDVLIRAEQERLRKALPTLRGKNLACWCKPGDACHADVLLEIANAPTGSDAP